MFVSFLCRAARSERGLSNHLAGVPVPPFFPSTYDAAIPAYTRAGWQGNTARRSKKQSKDKEIVKSGEP
jgi:hypothetical protein